MSIDPWNGWIEGNKKDSYKKLGILCLNTIT